MGQNIELIFINQSVSVNGDNVTTWTDDCTTETKKPSELDESVTKLIESARNAPGHNKDLGHSYITSAWIKGVHIETVSYSYGFNGNYESGTFPVASGSNTTMIGIAVVNHLVAFVWKCGSIELKPSRCLTDSEWDLVESSRDDFQNQLQESMRRGMGKLQWGIWKLQKNLSEQFKSNFPMNFGNLFSNGLAFVPANPFTYFQSSYNPMGMSFPSWSNGDSEQ